MRKGGKKKQWVPPYLVPKVGKKWAAFIYRKNEDAWRLFAEGCLRNRYFHEAIYARGYKCLVCEKPIDDTKPTKSKKIQKHHNGYLRTCIGYMLDEDHTDIYREAEGREYPRVPDCRDCHAQNPDYFSGCVKMVFPVHTKCHKQIHEQEKLIIKAVSYRLGQSFKGCMAWPKRLLNVFNKKADPD